MCFGRYANFYGPGWTRGRACFQFPSIFPGGISKDPEALSKLKKIAGEYEIPENILELELTESVFFDDQGISHVKGRLRKCTVWVSGVP